MYSELFRSVIFPVMELSQGTKIQKYLKWLNKTQWWKREELEELQNKKLRALIRHAYENVPYYHNLFKEIGLMPDDIKSKEDLIKLPFLTKDIIRRNLPQLLAKNIPKSQFIEAHSSGSTGEPLKYYIDKESYSYGWAQTFRCWSWVGYKLGEPYVKISLNPRTKLSKKLQDYLMNCIYIYSSDVNEKTLKKQLQGMARAKIIRGYASSMYILAKLIRNSGIRNVNLLKPNAIMTTGDTLFSHYRELIESTFDCKVFDGYGGESTSIAFECEEHEGYHLCDETVILEFMRGEEPASTGELGEIVFTNLENYAMPFIRYKINDIGVKSDDCCSCGRGLSVMKSIEGRDTDIVVTPNGGFLVVHFFTILFEHIEGVEQFQVIQDKIDRLRINIVKNEKFTDADLRHIISWIKKHAGEEMEVNVEFVDSIPSTKSGKRRFVISNIADKYF
jgi:phenylacetate-CoA ligase